MSTTIGYKASQFVSFIANDRSVEDRTDRSAMKDIQARWAQKLVASFEDGKPLSMDKEKLVEVGERVEAITSILLKRKDAEAYFPQAKEFIRVLENLMDPKQEEWLTSDISSEIRDHHRSLTSGKLVSLSRDDLKGASGSVAKYARHFVGDSSLKQACFGYVYKDALNTGVLQSVGADKRRAKAADAFTAALANTANDMVDYVDQVLGHRMQVDGRMAEDARIKRNVMPGAKSATFTGGLKADIGDAVAEAMAKGIKDGVAAAQAGVDYEAIGKMVSAVVAQTMAQMKAQAEAEQAADDAKRSAKKPTFEEKAAKAKAEAEAAEAEVNSRKSKA